jgi:ribose 5-phosphate isomerase B
MDPNSIERIVREVVKRLTEAGEASRNSVSHGGAASSPVSLVTEDVVKAAIRRGERAIPVMESTVVTPLALDLLKESEIRLEQAEGGAIPQAQEGERRLRIAVAADVSRVGTAHGLARWLTSKGHTVEDIGAASVERPGYLPLVIKAARQVSDGSCDMAITLDADGARAAIAGNKLRGVRSAVCRDVASARRARAELDANVINLGMDTVGETLARQILSVWLTTQFDQRHRAGLDQVKGLEL